MTVPDENTLDLAELTKGCTGITPEWGAGLAQAASVCLEAQGHTSPHAFGVSGSVAHDHTLYWLVVDARMRRCFNDLEEAGEHGAYGIASSFSSLIASTLPPWPATAETSRLRRIHVLPNVSSWGR